MNKNKKTKILFKMFTIGIFFVAGFFSTCGIAFGAYDPNVDPITANTPVSSNPALPEVSIPGAIPATTNTNPNPPIPYPNAVPASTNKVTSTATPAGTTGSITFPNPVQFTTVEGFLGGILSAIQRIVVILALIFVAIGAVMILVSAGVPEMVEKGKKAITMALVGLSLGIAAPSILKELAGFLGWGTTTSSTVNMAMSLSQIALRVLNFLLGITGVLALIMLIIGAIMYLTSAGEEERIETGKKIFKNALIGVVIVMASMVLVKQIALFFVVG